MSKINCKKDIVGDEIWVSCSGGVDSIAGAHYLMKKLKRKVKLFHYNHRLREQNDDMELSVTKFAQKFNLLLEIRHREGTLNEPLSEASLRNLRLRSMQSVVGEDDIVFCHHLDDCVESYLMNCFNGVPEYCPIPVMTRFEFVDLEPKTRVLRPFLLTPKSSFERYSTEYNLDKFVVEDETNRDQKYRRNWVRHRARPVIEEHYPGIQKVVFKKMVEFYDAKN